MTEKAGAAASTSATDDELSVPRASIKKMIKELVPNMRISIETKDLIINCCNEFIRLIASESNEVSNALSKKKIAPEHVLTALENLGFKSYLPEVKECIEEAKEAALKKRRTSSKMPGQFSEEELFRQQQELFAKEMYKGDTPTLLKRPDIKKETPFSLEQAKRFNTWKVRKDMVEVDKVQQKVAERRRTAQEAAKRREDELGFPTIHRSQTGLPTPLVDRKGADSFRKFDIRTPVLPPGPQASSNMPSRSGAHNQRLHESQYSLPADVSGHAANKYRIKEGLLQAAEDYVKSATPQSDRRVIDKALRTSNKHYKEDPRTLQVELPDPKVEAEKWLEKATDDEQRIALQFFKSVGGMKLMGVDGREKQQRLNQLLTALENGEAKQPTPRRSYSDEQMKRERRQRNLQFVRLLSPTTRSKRLEQQSWHHLPLYRPRNRTDNVRSHYTQPQKVQPLHFSIHPDWGP
ncbi:uncharacterized protein [Watersipora subatra]|uniref:uncharacterized protein n=1 Tax=Watersipora subatra TaxID=2589382 RepID=UPI00355B068C